MTTFYVRVKPGENRFHIDMSGDYPTIFLESPAEHGHANQELLTKLAAILNTNVGILSGHQSRRKKLVADRQKEDIMRRLTAHSEQS